MKRISAIILVLALQACATRYPSPFQPPQDGQLHAVLQSTLKKPGFFRPAQAHPQIRSINGRLISPREEETWKLSPYSLFNIPPGDTFVELNPGGYVRFLAKPNRTYTISEKSNPNKQSFTLSVRDSQGHIVAHHVFQKNQRTGYNRSEQEEKVLDAIVMNDIQALKALLKKGVDPDWISSSASLSPLRMAVKENNIDALKVLIAAGAKINSVAGAHALSVSAEQGGVAIARLLLDHGADPNLRVIGRNSALMKAAKNGHVQMVRLLLEKGAYTKFRNFDGKTAFDLAKASGYEELASLLSR